MSPAIVLLRDKITDIVSNVQFSSRELQENLTTFVAWYENNRALKGLKGLVPLRKAAEIMRRRPEAADPLHKKLAMCIYTFSQLSHVHEALNRAVGTLTSLDEIVDRIGQFSGPKWK